MSDTLTAMHLLHLRVFQRQVADQCLYALTGAQLIDDAAPIMDQDKLWIGCQQFVTGAANVSKALWGQRAKYADSREQLRASLEVKDSSALRDVSFRNHFEHYDERIDRWWANSKTHIFLDRMISSQPTNVGLDPQDRFRVYDPAGHHITFWDEEFPVQPILTELRRVHQIAKTEADKPHWAT